MNPRMLWKQLTDAGLTTQEAAPEGLDTELVRPWYVRLLYGFSGWLASWFFLGFFALGFFDLFGDEWAMMIVGLLLNLPAFFVYRKNNESDFWRQVVLVLSLAGQLCVALALFEKLGFNKTSPLMLLVIYQSLLFVLMADYLHRLLSALFAFGAAFYAFSDWVLLPLLPVVVAGCFVWLWMRQEHWGKAWPLFEPLSVALSVVLVVISSTQLQGIRGRWMFSPVLESPPLLSSMQLGSQLLTAGLVLYLLWMIMQENKGQFQLSMVQKVVAMVLVLLVSFFVSGLAIALVVLLVGVARRSLWLQALGILACLGFVSWFYYDLSSSLWVKSVSLMVLGILLLMLYRLLRLGQSSEQVTDQAEVKVKEDAMSKPKWQQKVVILTMALCFVVVNHAVWQKEQLLTEGRTIYLPLAPVDPRSLMQGDYMRVRFALSRTIAQQQDQAEADVDLVVVRVGENRVAEFDGLFTGQALGADQLKLKFKRKGFEVQVGSGAFFFQEGQAKLFDTAEFGELVVDDSGHVLLKALRDKDLKLLGINRLD